MINFNLNLINQETFLIGFTQIIFKFTLPRFLCSQNNSILGCLKCRAVFPGPQGERRK